MLIIWLDRIMLGLMIAIVIELIAAFVMLSDHNVASIHSWWRVKKYLRRMKAIKRKWLNTPRDLKRFPDNTDGIGFRL